MTPTSEIITAVSASLTPVGVAIAFVWNKIEKRFARIELAFERCERGRAVKLIVIELLWQELERNVPTTPVLARAKRLLDNLKRDGEADAD